MEINSGVVRDFYAQDVGRPPRGTLFPLRVFLPYRPVGKGLGASKHSASSKRMDDIRYHKRRKIKKKGGKRKRKKRGEKKGCNKQAAML